MFNKIDPSNYPLKKGESWWIVHPNSSGGEFLIPYGAITLCTNDFLDFKKNTIYAVAQASEDGWVNILKTPDESYSVPQYLFARYFDANVFIRGGIREIDEPPKYKELNWTD